MLTNTSDEQNSYNIYIDNKKIDNLLIQHISLNDYYNLVVNNLTLSNTLYIISSDNVNTYNEQIKYVANGTDLLDAINLNLLCVAISSINENVFSLSTSGVPSVQVKKVSDLCSATNINDQDLLLVVNENNSKNITVKELRKSILSSIFLDHEHEPLGRLAFKNYFYINDISGKIPSDYIENLSALAFKNKITSDDISGQIPADLLGEMYTNNTRLSGYSSYTNSNTTLSNGDSLNTTLGKLSKAISNISNKFNDLVISEKSNISLLTTYTYISSSNLTDVDVYQSNVYKVKNYCNLTLNANVIHDLITKGRLNILAKCNGQWITLLTTSIERQNICAITFMAEFDLPIRLEYKPTGNMSDIIKLFDKNEAICIMAISELVLK